jgi:hypothetical protein
VVMFAWSWMDCVQIGLPFLWVRMVDLELFACVQLADPVAILVVVLAALFSRGPSSVAWLRCIVLLDAPGGPL